jgi:hypothetical protein
MFNKYKEKVINRIIRHCMTTYTPIDLDDMVLGDLLFNRKCHLNAVQRVKENKAKEVYLCVCIARESNDVIVHFINKNEDDKYVDNTLGWCYKAYTYYIVRKIEENEYNNISDILANMKKELVFKHSNKIMRKLAQIDYDNYV